jgi:hypothetical protein
LEQSGLKGSELHGEFSASDPRKDYLILAWQKAAPAEECAEAGVQQSMLGSRRHQTKRLPEPMLSVGWWRSV